MLYIKCDHQNLLGVVMDDFCFMAVEGLQSGNRSFSAFFEVTKQPANLIGLLARTWVVRKLTHGSKETLAVCSRRSAVSIAF